jgi:hypothetical protein
MKALIKLTKTNPLLKTGLNIENIKLQLEETQKSGESLFKQTLQTAKMFSDCLDYFKSSDCKEILKQEKIILKVEDFIIETFGLKKAWVYRSIQAHKTTQQEKDSFINSKPLNWGIEQYLKFLKEGTQEPKETEKPILSLTYGDIKLKINSKNELVSTTSREQIQAIITRLTAELSKIK